MTICKPYKAIQRAVMDDSVRVQNKNIFAAACADTGIVSSRKTKIFLVLHHANLRIVIANKFNGVVNGPVIRDYYFEVRLMGSIVNGTQAVSDYPKVIPANNDD
jgi:hypothetical protein